jgi:hypothetical protein
VIPSTTIGAGFLAGAPDGPHSTGTAVAAANTLYRELSTSTTATVHALAEREQRTIRTTTEEPR